MKRLSKFYCSPLCLLLFSICHIFNMLDETVFLFFICFIHEMGHIIMAKIFHCEIEKVTLNIFGFSCEIKDIEYQKIGKQILIFLAGPMTIFITLLILFLLKKFEIINEYQFQKYNENNIALCLFNLLPLYPLDGGRILDIINRNYYPVKESILIKKVWTIVCLIVLCYVLYSQKQLILLIVMISMILIYLLSSKYEYIKYLEKRLLMNIDYEKKVSFEKEIFHFKNNFYWKKDELVNEKEHIPFLIIRELKNKNKKQQKKYINF